METIKSAVGVALWLAVSAVLILDAQTPAAGTPAPSGRRARVAVVDFDYATVYSGVSAIFGTNVDVGKGVGDLLVNYLVKDGSYSVIER